MYWGKGWVKGFDSGFFSGVSPLKRIFILLFIWVSSGLFWENASGQTIEFDGGETVFSQNSQYYFAEAGDFLNIGNPEEKKNKGQ